MSVEPEPEYMEDLVWEPDPQSMEQICREGFEKLTGAILKLTEALAKGQGN